MVIEKATGPTDKYLQQKWDNKLTKIATELANTTA